MDLLKKGFSGAGFDPRVTVGTPKGRAEFGAPKPKPNFDWEDLDQHFAPALPTNGIGIRDIMEHFKVKSSRAQQIACEGCQRGLLKRIGKGMYIRP